MIIKCQFDDDIRRFAAATEAVTFLRLRAKIRTLFDLDDTFLIKYRDNEGDLVTISCEEELQEIIATDVNAARRGEFATESILKIVVISTQRLNKGIIGNSNAEDAMSNLSITAPGAGGLAAAVAPADKQSHRHLLGILRDISLYIAAREDLEPVKSWATEKKFIGPESVAAAAASADRLRFSQIVKNSPSGHIETLPEVMGWSVDRVGDWLKMQGFEDMETTCKENDITGEVLLALSHNELKELGIQSTGRRVKLLNAIADLRSSITASP